MSLPVINNKLYKTQLPSTKQEITYRPFLVGEEKIFLQAKEEGDTGGIMDAIIQVLGNCIQEDIDVSSLAIYDLEYMFLQIRVKSVGQEEDFILRCKHCEAENSIPFDFNKDIYVQNLDKEVDNKVTIGEIVLELRPFDLEDIKGMGAEEDPIKIVSKAINKIKTAEKVYVFADYTAEEQEQFINQLTSKQLEEIGKYIASFPTIVADLSYTCVSCGKDNEDQIKGLAGFFT